MASQYPPSLRVHLPALVLVLETAFILLFYFFISYEDRHPEDDLSVYPAFQDVNAMVMFGFGFLLAFLRRFGFSSIGFTFLIAALGAQWAVVVDGFVFHFLHGEARINLQSIVRAIMSVTAVLVSAGAVLGKANLIQLIWMAVIEVTIYGLNRWIAVAVLKVDSQVSLRHVHLFGAYFGLTVSWWFYHTSLSQNVKESSNPVSDLFAMLGTLFLWVFWPSFNSALIEDVMERRTAIYNTYFAIVASTVAAFAISAASSRDGKLNMGHVHRATLAGGIAVGFSAPIIQQPWIAMVLGLAAGTVSMLGSVIFKTYLNSKIRIHDTCGVHHMFGLPSLLGGLFHVTLTMINSWGNLSVVGYSVLIDLAALSVTIILGLVTGFITGFFLTLKLWQAPPVTKYFDDQAYWEPLAIEYRR